MSLRTPAPRAFIYEIDVSGLSADGSPAPDSAFKKAKWQFDPDSDELYMDIVRMKDGIKRGTQYFLLARKAGKAASPMIPVYQRTRPDRWVWARTTLYAALVKDRYVAWRRSWYTSARYERKRRID